MNQKTKTSLITIFIIVILSLTLTGYCDSPPPGFYKVDIQGAKIVSEGGYFRFYVKNISNASLNVLLLNYSGSKVFLEPNDNVTYDIIAPEINLLFKNVTYIFQISYRNSSISENHSYTVTVIKTDLIRQFEELQGKLNQTLFFLVITTGICVLIGIRLLIEELFKFFNFLRKRHLKK